MMYQNDVNIISGIKSSVNVDHTEHIIMVDTGGCFIASTHHASAIDTAHT